MRLACTMLAFGLAACSAPAVEERENPKADSGEQVWFAHDREIAPVDEALLSMTTCMQICATTASLGCAGALAACWFTDIITLGSTTLPCVAVSAVACATGTGAVLTCDVLCGE